MSQTETITNTKPAPTPTAGPKIPNPVYHHRRLALQIFFGIGMGAGLTLAGMTRADAALDFFDLKKLIFEPSKWNYDLMIVFPVALAVHSAIFWKLVMKRKTPIFDDHFHIPTNNLIDKELVGGAAMFGIGWAIGGFCPGPGVIGIITGELKPIIYTASLFGGFMLTNLYRTKRDEPKTSWWAILTRNEMIQYTVGLGAILAGLYFKKPLQYLPAPQITMSNSGNIAAIGGGVIGTSVALMMYFNGQILGNSGILGGIVNPHVKHKWSRLLFWAGLGLGSLAVTHFIGLPAFMDLSAYSVARFAIGGLITGVGTSFANGCTSGHGICGVSRLSPRSIVATATFFVTALITATLVN